MRGDEARFTARTGNPCQGLCFRIIGRPKHRPALTTRMNISSSAARKSGDGLVAAVPLTLASVLIVDDEEIVRNTLGALLQADGYDAVAASGAEQGLALLRSRQFEVAIVDLIMPGMDGIRTIAALKEVDPDLEVIILTGCATVESTIGALRQGACDLLRKPVGLSELRPALRRALEKRRPKAALPVYQASRPLMATLDHQEVVSAALSLAQHTLRATVAALALPPNEGANLTVHLSNEHGAFTAAHARCLAEIALRAGEPLRNLVFDAAPSGHAETTMPAGSVLTFPLGTGNSLIGALVLWRSQGQAQFSQFDRQQGSLLADEIVVALDNSRLYRELAHKAEELQAVRSSVARTEARARAVMQTAQAAIDRAEARAKAIIETAQDAIVLLDQDGVVWDLNPQAITMLGRAREEAIGKNLNEIAISAKFREGFRMHLESAFLTGRHPAQGCLEVCAVRANGEEFPLEISSTVIETKQGKLLSTFARDITDRQRAERATRESEAKLQAVFDGVKTGILVIDAETHRIVDANPLALDLVGASRERVVGAVCHKFICPAENGRCPVADLGQVVDESERILLTASGERRNIIKTVRPIVIAGRKLLLESFVDITARKQAEQALAEAQEHFHSLFASNPLPTFLFDAETLQYLDVNDAAVSASGYSREEFLQMRVVDVVQPGVAPLVAARVQAIRPQSLERSEARYRLKDGRYVDVESDFRVLEFRGRKVVLSVSQDVTARKRAERALRESEDRYRDLVESSALLIGMHDARGRILSLNTAAAQFLEAMHGEETAETSLTHYIPRELLPQWEQYLDAVLSAGHAEGLMVLATPSGKRKIVEYRNTLRQRDGQEPVVRWTAQDVTERVQAEEALRVSENRYRLLFERNAAGVLRSTVDGRILGCNDSLARLLGYSSPGELLNAHVRQIWDDPADLEQMLAELSQQEKLSNYEVRFRRQDGKPVWAVLNIHRTDRQGGEPAGLEGTVVDITQRKLAEERLLLTQFSIDHASDAITWLDDQGRIVYVNEAGCQSFGRSREELLSLTIAEIDPDFPVEAWEKSWERVKAAGSVTFEARHMTKLGRVFPVEVTENYLQFGGKEYSCSFSRDITERKEAERQINLQVTALKAAANGIVITDQEGEILWANPAFTRLTGYEPHEVVGRSHRVLKSGSQDKAFYQNLWRTIMAGKVWQGELVNKRKDGSHYTEEMTITPVQDDRGAITHFIAIKQDVSERKRAQDDLYQARQMLETVLNTIPQRVFWKDRTLRYLGCNRTFAVDAGLREPREVVGKDDFELAWKESANFYRADDEQVLSQESAKLNFEERQSRPDGSLRWLRTNKMPLRNPEGAVIGLLGTYEDVTDRKRAEEELSFKTALLEAEAETTIDGILVVDSGGRVLQINRRFVEMINLPPEFASSNDDQDVLQHVANQAKDSVAFLERVKYLYAHESERAHDELEFRDGKVFDRYTSPLRDRAGRFYGRVWYFRDITQRKRAEHQTRLQTAALESAANGIAIADRNGQILWVNRAFAHLTGYSSEEVLGRTMRVLKSGQQAPAFYANLWQTLLSGEVWQGEIVNRRKDGTLYTDDTTITPVRDADGTVTHFVAIKQDVTERRREKQALLERTVYLNSLFDISPVGIVVLDTNGRIQMANSTFERLFLYSRQEIIGAGLDDLIVPPEFAAEAKTLTALCLGGGGAQATSQRRRKDGSLVDTEIYGVPLVIDAELRGYLGLYQDITTRKRAEADLIRYAEDLEISKAAQEEHARELARLVEELAQERDLLGTVMDNLPDCIFYKDRQSRFLRANPPLARMLGLNDPREAVGKTDFDFFPAEEARAYLSDEQRVIETGEALIGRAEKVRQPDGQYRWYATSTVPIRDNHGRVLGLVGISRDMTESMEAEKKIRESEAKYRSLIANIPDVIWTADSELQFAFISTNVERLSGFSLDEVYRTGARLFLQNVHPDDVGKVTNGMGALFARGEPYDVEFRVRRKDGEWIWIHDRAVATYEINGVRYADGLLSDITLSKRAEETLRASEERYRELFENASDIVYTTGMDTRLTSLNRVGQKILGYSAQEATQLDLEQLVAPRHRQLLHQSLAQLLAGDADLTLEVEITNKEARQMMLEVKPRLIYRGGKPVGVQGIARDITGRDEAEVELRHAQKLESVGRLAAGIAHEINTPIQFVGDNTRFLQDSFQGLQTLLAKYQELRAAADSSNVDRDLLAEVSRAEDESDCAYLLEEIPKALSQTLEGVTRVATIVRAMKEFAHPEGKEMAAADLNRALLSTLTVARNELKYVADVETEFGELPPVVCNIGDLNQVFLNLLVNAAHAIADVVKGTGGKGKIRVQTVSEGSTVLVTIADTGCGIPETNRNKVFDPFFTTKEVGRGTGQGLAIARSVVVDRHQGALTFDSEVGRGTTFYVRLPLHPGVAGRDERTP